MNATKYFVGLLLFVVTATLIAGDFNASCKGGIKNLKDGQFSDEGNLIQLIWAGQDGKIDPPSADPNQLGQPTGDDEFIRDTFVGNGYLLGYADGRFDKLFTHSSLQAGRSVYLRAWDTDVITSIEDSYGDSDLYQIQQANEFEYYDFPPFMITTFLNGKTNPVELSGFSISSFPGRVVLEWTTQTETENLGFHVYKSDSPSGQKIRATKDLIKGALNSETRHDYRWEEKIDQDGEIVYYWIADLSTSGVMRFYGPKRIETQAAPDQYALEQNYPNPFNPTTTITFSLKEDGLVTLAIYNLVGQVVRELVKEERSAGQYSIEWNGLNENGYKAPSGLYFYTIQVNGYRETRKMALMK
ncbi:T9SS C-terminal target domain-containing protein [candidate division KSB1 bacterium]|nr:T9SS type A sorting domain-containing protein [candidate division KSB1 bacterium]RQW01545.1 MAG: T9SS C-terminal target domain-containing protein [candidate division KSB1 bacterium]